MSIFSLSFSLSLSLSLYHIHATCVCIDDSLTLDSLLIQLRPQVTSEWFKFGLALGVAEEVLNKYLGYPSEECIVEMLDYWLRNHGSKPTWKEVAKALKDIGLLQLAEDILKVYTTGKLELNEDIIMYIVYGNNYIDGSSMSMGVN